MIKNPSDATVRRIMKENDVAQSAIQLANSGKNGPQRTAKVWYTMQTRFGGALHSLVVRLLWEQNVGGSNPLAPTIMEEKT